MNGARALEVRHTTSYRYARPLRFAQHRVMFRLRSGHDIRVLDAGVDANVLANVDWIQDTRSNWVTLVAPKTAADELRIECRVRLSHRGVRGSTNSRSRPMRNADPSPTRQTIDAISARCSSATIRIRRAACSSGAVRSWHRSCGPTRAVLRPYLLGAAVLAVVAAWVIYARRRQACASDAACGTVGPARRAPLWLVLASTIVLLALIWQPWIEPLLLPWIR